MTSGSAGLELERRPEDELRRSVGPDAVLEPAVAIGQAELRRRNDRLGALRVQHARATRTPAMSALVGAGVGPHGATDGTGDGEPELEPGQARLSGSRWRPWPSARRPRRCSGRPRTRMPSARSWMTRPRTPRSLMTVSLPRPSTRCGIPRVRANRTRPRSSKVLWTVANRSAGPPTRIVVKPRERLVARGLDPDPALDLGPDRDRSRTSASGRPSRRRAARPHAVAIAAGSGSGRPRRATASRGRRRPRRHAGRPSARAAAAIARCAAGSSSRAAASSSAVGVEASSSTSRAAPASTSGGRWRAGARRRADTARRPSATRARSPRPGSTSRRGPRRGRRRPGRASMSSRRNGCGPVSVAPVLGQGLARRQRRRVAVLAGDVDDRHALDERAAGPSRRPR